MTKVKEMSQKRSTRDDSPEKGSGLNRRAFLEASVKGVGVSAVGAATLGGWSLAETAVAGSNSEGLGFASTLSADGQPTSITVSIDPGTAVDTWSEPWVWRPWDWPSGQLHLSLVENAAPVAVTGSGFENVRPLLFSYGGITPGPTIRMFGDDTLKVKLRNHLGLDQGFTSVGPSPDLGALPPGVDPNQVIVEEHPDWCLEHIVAA